MISERKAEKLFKKIKQEVEKIDGVFNCAGNLQLPARKIVIYLKVGTTEEVKEIIIQKIYAVVGNNGFKLGTWEMEFETEGEFHTN
jgi:hypothetical protein